MPVQMTTSFVGLSGTWSHRSQSTVATAINSAAVHDCSDSNWGQYDLGHCDNDEGDWGSDAHTAALEVTACGITGPPVTFSAAMCTRPTLDAESCELADVAPMQTELEVHNGTNSKRRQLPCDGFKRQKLEGHASTRLLHGLNHINQWPQ